MRAEPICMIDGCEQPVKAAGLCENCYTLVGRSKRLTLPEVRFQLAKARLKLSRWQYVLELRLQQTAKGWGRK